MNRLVVLGSVNADHVLRVPHFPRPGETLTGHSYQVVPGGKGANQAVAAARLGAEVSFIARIGDDAIGHQMKTGFAKDGIDVSAVELDPELPTGIAIIYVSDEGENSIGISAEANGALTPSVVKGHEAMIAAAHTLLLQLEVPLESVQEAARLARAHGTRVVLNPAPARPLSSRTAGTGRPHHPQPDRSRAVDRRQGHRRGERSRGGCPLPPDGYRGGDDHLGVARSLLQQGAATSAHPGFSGESSRHHGGWRYLQRRLAGSRIGRRRL